MGRYVTHLASLQEKMTTDFAHIHVAMQVTRGGPDNS